jgi:hypothetical protein
MLNKTASTHKDCPVDIRWKKYKNKPLPTPALFCSKHGKFLDWLPEEDAYDLINNHKIPVTLWESKKPASKPPQAKVKNNLLDEIYNSHIKHKDCPLNIRWRLFKNQSKPTPGLFCSCHNIRLRWLNFEQADELIKLEVPVK